MLNEIKLNVARAKEGERGGEKHGRPAVEEDSQLQDRGRGKLKQIRRGSDNLGTDGDEKRDSQPLHHSFFLRFF
jgi:hypothetical protein